MKEAEWLTCLDPIRMLEFLKTRRVRARSFRLFGAACCRRAWSDLSDGRSRDAVEVLERYADGLGKKADQEELRRAFEAAEAAAVAATPRSRTHYAALAVERAAEPTQAWWTARYAAAQWMTASGKSETGGRVSPKAEASVVAGLARDIFGNPFRPVTFDAAWQTSTVVALARGMYDSRDFSAMPILADALQDAGCDREDVLDHCRGPGPHVRGCWVVDLVLGKA
jgi:hypothetical protein